MKKTNLSSCEAALSPEGHLSAAQRRLSRAAKRSALLIICALSALAGAAQTNVSVFNFKATPDASATTATFNVSWTSAGNDSVWVFVDYNTAGTMKRLPLTAATASAGAAVHKPNNQGAWVVAPAGGGNPFATTVTLFSGTTYSYGSCAYAIPQPPKGQYEAVDKINLTGTPPFEVTFTGNDGTVSVPAGAASPYTIPVDKTIASFTDATRAPGVIKCKAPTAYTFTASRSSYCEEEEGVYLLLSKMDYLVNYQLYSDTLIMTKAGVGTPSSFTKSDKRTPQAFKAGTYTAVGVYQAALTAPEGSPAFCATTMTGTAVVKVSTLPLPAAPKNIIASATTVCVGAALTFHVADPIPGATYTWTANTGGTPTGSSYSVRTNVQVGSATATVRVTVVNGEGAICMSPPSSVTSATVSPPLLVLHPENQAVCNGTTARMAVLATGPATYTWYKNNTEIPASEGGNASIYITPNVESATTYKVRVANGPCTFMSNPAVVSITNDRCTEADCTPPGATVAFAEFVPCRSAATGSTWTLTDTREPANLQSYKIKKLPDGSIWTVQDLKFGDRCAQNTDFGMEPGKVVSNRVTSLSAGSTLYYGDCTDNRIASTPARRGYFYDWIATVNLRAAYDSDTVAVPETPWRGICPEGWHVPSMQDVENAVWIDVLGGMQTAPNFPLLEPVIGGLYGIKDWTFGYGLLEGNGVRWNCVDHLVEPTRIRIQPLYSTYTTTISWGDDPKFVGKNVRCRKD